MDQPKGQLATAAAPLTWRRWLFAAFAGAVTYLATLGAIYVILHPEHATGTTSLYASIVISFFAGAVVAGLTVKARSSKRWIAAFLVTLLSVAGIAFLYLSYLYLTIET